MQHKGGPVQTQMPRGTGLYQDSNYLQLDCPPRLAAPRGNMLRSRSVQPCFYSCVGTQSVDEDVCHLFGPVEDLLRQPTWVHHGDFGDGMGAWV